MFEPYAVLACDLGHAQAIWLRFLPADMSDSIPLSSLWKPDIVSLLTPLGIKFSSFSEFRSSEKYSNENRATSNSHALMRSSCVTCSSTSTNLLRCFSESLPDLIMSISSDRSCFSNSSSWRRSSLGRRNPSSASATLRAIVSLLYLTVSVRHIRYYIGAPLCFQLFNTRPYVVIVSNHYISVVLRRFLLRKHVRNLGEQVKLLGRRIGSV